MAPAIRFPPLEMGRGQDTRLSWLLYTGHWGLQSPLHVTPELLTAMQGSPGLGNCSSPPPPPPEQEGEEREGHLNRGRAGSQGCRVDADGRGPAQHRSKEVG